MVISINRNLRQQCYLCFSIQSKCYHHSKIGAPSLFISVSCHMKIIQIPESGQMILTDSKVILTSEHWDILYALCHSAPSMTILLCVVIDMSNFRSPEHWALSKYTYLARQKTTVFIFGQMWILIIWTVNPSHMAENLFSSSLLIGCFRKFGISFQWNLTSTETVAYTGLAPPHVKKTFS